MRHRLLLMSLSLLVVSGGVLAQTVDLRFVVASFDGTNYDVTAEIKANASTFTLGVSTFAFTYDSSALTLSSTSTPLNYSDGSYSTQSLTVLPPNASIFVFLKFMQPGSVVPLTWTSLATLHFTVKNPAGQSSLAWNGTTTVIFSSSGSTIAENQLLGLNTNPLPVELTRFNASALESGVQLEWNTATETQNFGFDVERKCGSSDWTKIGFVSGHGTSATPRDYSYVDNGVVSGEMLYRLKQIDVAGTFEYSEVVTVDIKNLTAVVLEQNYPNPFNPSTTIHYRVRQAGNIRLTIVDLLGRDVTELVSGYQEAGTYAVQFNGTNLATGTYICRMQTPQGIQTRKLLLKK